MPKSVLNLTAIPESKLLWDWTLGTSGVTLSSVNTLFTGKQTNDDRDDREDFSPQQPKGVFSPKNTRFQGLKCWKRLLIIFMMVSPALRVLRIAGCILDAH